MIWILVGVIYAALALASLTLMLRPRTGLGDQITYALVGVAAIFLCAHSLLAFIR